MNKLISVIVPIYNTEKYINACVDSIISQTYKNIEIILVDDGSQDKSPIICETYKKKDARVKVIHKENGGLSSARNAGIDIANGEYLAFVDSDDSIHHTFIASLYQMCEENDCDIAQCDYLATKDDSIKLEPQKKNRINIISSQEAVKKCCEGYESVKFIVSWDKLYKAYLFSDIRFPEGKIHEDNFVSYQLFWKANKIVISNQCLYWYLQRRDSIIGRKYNKNRLDSLDASKEKLEFCKKNKLNQEYVVMLLHYYRDIWKNHELVKENIENADEILLNLEKEALKLQKEILNLSGRSVLENLRIVYPHLNKKEKEKYYHLYGKRIEFVYQENYKFPFDSFQKGTNIAIYGAGAVGKSYISQLSNTKYCKVSVWVDNLWRDYEKLGYNVEPIDSLLKNDFDYVLIAVKNPQIAQEMKENIMSWGIDEKKIVIEYPDDIKGSRQRFIDRSESILDSCVRRCFLMNTPDHGNLGDQALAMSAVSYIKDYFLNDELVEVTGRQWDCCKKIIKNKMKCKDIIFIVGGGFMGDLWKLEDSRVKEIIETFPDNKIIFLPQSFYYQNDIFSIAEFDKKFYQKYQNVYFMHREKNSYEYFVKNIVSDTNRSKLYPDMVLYMNSIQPKIRESKILLCFRLDKEKVATEEIERIYDDCKSTGYDVLAIDTVVDRSMTIEERTQEVFNLLEDISKAKLLITDRLHGMLFSTITGTPCIAIDNVSKKVSGVFKWLKNSSYIKCVGAEEITEKLVNEMLSITESRYNNSMFTHDFDDMAATIYNWIDKE